MKLKLKFVADEDGSACGTLIVSSNGYEFLFVPITHTKQLEMMDTIVGEYAKLKS